MGGALARIEKSSWLCTVCPEPGACCLNHHTKYCTKCGKSKDVTEFNKRAQSNDGYDWVCRVCSRECKVAWRRKNLKRYHENGRINCRKAYKKYTPEYRMWRSAKTRAFSKRLPFSIKISDIKIPLVCPVLGIPLFNAKKQPSPNSPSLDAIIPKLGYVHGNIAVISLRANNIKSDGTLDEHKKIVSWLEGRK